MSTVRVKFEANHIGEVFATPLVAEIDVSKLRDWNDYMETTEATVRGIEDPETGKLYKYSELHADDRAELEKAFHGALDAAFDAWKVEK